MATWTTPTTRVALEVLDDADWNTDLVENLKFLYQPPRIAVQTSAPFSVPNATLTAANFDTEAFKSDLTHSTSSNPNKVTVATTGIYLVTARSNWDVNASNRRYISIYLNGSMSEEESRSPASGGYGSNALAFVKYLTAADYLELKLYQDSGGALNAYPRLEVVWMSGP